MQPINDESRYIVLCRKRTREHATLYKSMI
jgi:hypothetical protein